MRDLLTQPDHRAVGPHGGARASVIHGVAAGLTNDAAGLTNEAGGSVDALRRSRSRAPSASGDRA